MGSRDILSFFGEATLFGELAAATRVLTEGCCKFLLPVIPWLTAFCVCCVFVEGGFSKVGRFSPPPIPLPIAEGLFCTIIDFEAGW